MSKIQNEIYLEHANLTVSNPDEVAELFGRLFGWQVRWSGDSMDGGYTVHIGAKNSYIALYTRAGLKDGTNNNHQTSGNLNHLGIVVPDLATAEQKVLNEGLETFNHGSYEPGQRFYFMINDELEVELISYE